MADQDVQDRESEPECLPDEVPESDSDPKCLPDEVLESESEPEYESGASSEPDAAVYEDPEPAVEEPEPEPEPKPEPEPAVEEPKPDAVISPESDPTVEPTEPEPEPTTGESTIAAVVAKEISPIHTVPIVYVATSEPHDSAWRMRNCVCIIL